MNIEVQWASEPVVAAIERNGGVITTAYYDIRSVGILTNPKQFFEKGKSRAHLILTRINYSSTAHYITF